jgi:hypothetical protein
MWKDDAVLTSRGNGRRMRCEDVKEKRVGQNAHGQIHERFEDTVRVYV